MDEDDTFPASLPMRAAHDIYMGVVIELAAERRLSLRERLAVKKIERNGWLARHAMRGAWQRYQAEGGEEGTGLGWFQWLVANWETILKMIMSIVALFGGTGAVAAPQFEAARSGASAMPRLDLALVQEIASALDVSLEKAGLLWASIKRGFDSIRDAA